MSRSARGHTKIVCARALAALAALFVVVSWVLPSAAATLEARDFKMAGDATKMRIVLNFDREPDPKWFLLRAPNRLVLDLPDTRFALDAKDLKARGLVKNVRYGSIGENASRLILTGNGPFIVDRLDVLANEDSSGYRLVADISAASDRKFDAALAVQATTTYSTATPKTGRFTRRTKNGWRWPCHVTCQV